MPRGPSLLHLVCDALALSCAFALAHYLRFSSGLFDAPLGRIAAGEWTALAGAAIPLWLLLLGFNGLYYARLKEPLSAELGALLAGSAQGLAALIVLTFAIRDLPDSRLALLLAFGLALLLLALLRMLLRRLPHARPRAVVIGTGPLAQYLARQLAAPRSRTELLGSAPDAQGAAAELLARAELIFCDSAQAGDVIQRLDAQQGGQPRAALHILPSAELAGISALHAGAVEGVATLSLKSAADLAVMRAIKRTLDVPLSLLSFALTAPLWLFCIAGIALTMPGPLFFSHERLGLNGRRIRVLKFRSMVKDAQLIPVDLAGFDEKYKLAHDPRVTPFGRLLRRLSFDELPQLINILRGDISIVGPRPIVPPELEKYGPWGRLLLTVPPGLTGLWQVSGRSDTTYEQRVDFDLYYISNWSFGLELLIILRTLPAILSRRGAY